MGVERIAERRLTATSYLVLALVGQAGQATPYELEVLAGGSLAEAWPISHTQTYQCSRALARAGLLEERREAAGRRRRFYRLTDAGRAALGEWLGTPASGCAAIRDPGLLQLCCGASVPDLAQVREAVHRRRLDEIETRRAGLPASARTGVELTLDVAAARERMSVAFWKARRG